MIKNQWLSTTAQQVMLVRQPRETDVASLFLAERVVVLLPRRTAATPAVADASPRSRGLHCTLAPAAEGAGTTEATTPRLLLALAWAADSRSA